MGVTIVGTTSTLHPRSSSFSCTFAISVLSLFSICIRSAWNGQGGVYGGGARLDSYAYLHCC